MFDLLLKNYFIIVYGITLFLALVKYRLYYDSVLKFFPILIAYTLLTEILGWYILKNPSFQLVYLEGYSINNSIIYNIYDLVFYVYICYVYYYSVEKTAHKKIIGIGALVFILGSFINIFFQDFILLPQIGAITIGSIVLIICILLYAIELKGKQPRTKTNENLLVWISAGLLLFYMLYPVILSIGLYRQELYSTTVKPIHHAALVIMHSCFIIGFVKMRPMKSV